MGLLLRRKSEGEDGVFGELWDLQERIAYTCERPWHYNDEKISCIPIGEYRVTQFQSPSKGHVFLLHDVPDRHMIEIHAGNTIDDTEGCILVGSELGEVDGKKAVIHSVDTLKSLLKYYPDPFFLKIIEDF